MKQPATLPITMFNNYVLIKLDESDEQTEGGLYLPTTKGERTDAWALKAVVTAVPSPEDNVIDDENILLLSLKPGDVIFVSKWEIHNLMLGTEKYAAVRAKDIMFKYG